MKKFILFMIGLVWWAGHLGLAQPPSSIGIGTTNPNEKAILDIESTTKGILIPRMNTSQREAITLTGPDLGMMVYDTDFKSPMYWNGLGWRHIGYVANFWQKTGDDLFYNEGNVGIGLNSPSYKLHIQNNDMTRSLHMVNEYEGTSSKYGLYTYLNADGTGEKTGIRTWVYAHDTDPSTVNGLYSSISTFTTSPAVVYGIRSTVGSNGTGTHFGVFGSAYGANNRAIQGSNAHADGWAGYFLGRGYFSTKLGVRVEDPTYQVQIDANETRAIDIVNNYVGSLAAYGMRAQINDVSTGAKYGVLADVNLPASHSSTVYGLYAHVESDTDPLGTHYGVYANAYGEGCRAVYGTNSHNDGWAGYFYGRGYFYKDVDISTKMHLRPTGYSSGASLIMKDNDGTETIKFHANQTTTNGAEILLYDDAGNKTIELDAEWGDGGPGRVVTGELQITAGSDVAEYFDVSTKMDIRPGMLVSIDPENPGELTITNQANDRKIAGVISGANGINPGMLMGQEASIADGSYPIAIAGRVYVYASVINGVIRPGDLLTSSDIPGTAMKVTDYEKARGAIIGKAMTELKEGDEFVLMLISLQ